MIRDYQPRVLIQREMSSPPLPPFPLRFNPRSILRSVPSSVCRSVSRYVLRSVPRSVFRSVPCFILFIVDKRRLSSLFWSLLTIIEQVLRHWCHDAQGLAGCPLTVPSNILVLNYYTKRLVFSRRSRTRKQSNWKTENETEEGLPLDCKTVRIFAYSSKREQKKTDCFAV